MKKYTILKTIRLACATLACTAMLPVALQAADVMKPMKGGEHLMMLNKVDTKKDLDALKTGDTFTMVCAKCKTVWTSRVRQGAKGAEVLMAHGQPQEIIGTHACKGCNSTLTVVAHGKGDLTELKHSCKSCGDESAFCCAAKAGGEKK